MIMVYIVCFVAAIDVWLEDKVEQHKTRKRIKKHSITKW
jgi:hypothetical protein